MKEEILVSLKELQDQNRVLVNLTDEEINQVLLDLADETISRTDEILAANLKDLERMDSNNPKYDRLLLNEKRIVGIANDIRNISTLKSPLKRALEERTLENGLNLKKVSVPLGVIGIVYESRPNVTFDVFALCFKSGNSCVLKGSRDAHFSNICIVNIIQEVLERNNVPKSVYLAPSERESLKYILEADGYIDMIIPRGGTGLIQFVRANSKVPVIETGAGIVHTYIDKTANLEKAKNIIRNAKTRRVSVCNALDTLLIHEDLLSELPDLVHGLDKNHQLEIYADQSSFEVLSSKYELLHKADESSFGTEFLSMKMAIKTVFNIHEALDHIYEHSSKHSEAIVAENPEIIEQFFNNVDAAVVYANASTAFTDGAQFGMGAEIGISTQKLHARGPMALNELTSYKWVVRGAGQVR